MIKKEITNFKALQRFRAPMKYMIIKMKIKINNSTTQIKVCFMRTKIVQRLKAKLMEIKEINFNQ